jgi:mercuric ion transport protein
MEYSQIVVRFPRPMSKAFGQPVLANKSNSMQNKLEKFGSFGTIVAAAACPVCFPKLALLGALFGLGALKQYETIFFYGAHVLIVLALVGHIVSYKRVQNRSLFALAVISALLFFTSLYVVGSEILSYVSLIGLVAATIWMIFENRRCARCEG